MKPLPKRCHQAITPNDLHGHDLARSIPKVCQFPATHGLRFLPLLLVEQPSTEERGPRGPQRLRLWGKSTVPTTPIPCEGAAASPPRHGFCCCEVEPGRGEGKPRWSPLLRGQQARPPPPFHLRPARRSRKTSLLVRLERASLPFAGSRHWLEPALRPTQRRERVVGAWRRRLRAGCHYRRHNPRPRRRARCVWRPPEPARPPPARAWPEAALLSRDRRGGPWGR